MYGEVSFETNLPEFRVGSIVLPSHWWSFFLDAAL